jgi:hypothetical protein
VGCESLSGPALCVFYEGKKKGSYRNGGNHASSKYDISYQANTMAYPPASVMYTSAPPVFLGTTLQIVSTNILQWAVQATDMMGAEILIAMVR